MNLMSCNAEVSGTPDASMCTTEGRYSIRVFSTTALFALGVFLIGTFLAEANKFTAPNRYLKEPLPSHFVGELVQRKFRRVLPAAWSASHPNDGGAWLRLGLIQSGNVGLFIAVQWGGRKGEPRFLNASRSADPREWGHARIHRWRRAPRYSKSAYFDRVVVLVLVVVVTSDINCVEYGIVCLANCLVDGICNSSLYILS